MSTLSQFGFGGGIKSIQRGVITLPAPQSITTTQTATINPVNTSKSILYYLGVRNGLTRTNIASSDYHFLASVLAMIELTNSTTITATIGANLGNLGNNLGNFFTSVPTVSWQLVEYY
jgi:hypothetical protein